MAQVSADFIEGGLRESEEVAKADGDYFSIHLRGAIVGAPELDEMLPQVVDRPVAAISPVEHAILLIWAYELKAQLEVLEQAEESLAGYAEGARFLLDAARQSRLQGARGALSALLDVPAELESAVTAALGDTLDAILIDADEVENALQLLETGNSGRAVLLPLDGRERPSPARPAGAGPGSGQEAVWARCVSSSPVSAPSPASA